MNGCSNAEREALQLQVDATENKIAVLNEHPSDSEETPSVDDAFNANTAVDSISAEPAEEEIESPALSESREQSADRSSAERPAAVKAPVQGQKRSNTKPSLGKLLQKQRHALGLTQRALAAQLGVKPAHVAYLETDRRRPSLGLLSRIATVLGIDREKLFSLAHPEASSLVAACARPKHQVAKDQAWKEFRYNKALLARHQVRPRELQVLAQVNLLGKVSAPRNFLFILNAIRQAVDEEE
jgi:transcriptional regulator with XRE-family HTH domain